MMETTTKSKKPTPLEKLYADKLHCKSKVREAEQRLNENFLYIQQNAGGILFSSATSFVIGRNMLPHIWAITKPALITWGIGKAQSMLLHKLFGKKKKK